MSARTGIPWTDSTWNSWWGCTKVAGDTACAHCYAEGTDKRAGGNHWGIGAPRRLLSEHARNEPFRWQRQADAFEAEHGRCRRVFTLSMGDLFDNEVEERWRLAHMDTMERCDRLEWQVCTKRISNLRKMVPSAWYDRWPRHVGVLITVVTQAEAERDIPRLLQAKEYFEIPWVGVSWEPAQEQIDFSPWLKGCYECAVECGWRSGRAPATEVCNRCYWEGTDAREFCPQCGLQDFGHKCPSCDGNVVHQHPDTPCLDWIIFGGKSGPNWNDRPFSIDWGRVTAEQCRWAGCAFFFKQVAAFRPTDSMIPAELMVREWPR